MRFPKGRSFAPLGQEVFPCCYRLLRMTLPCSRPQGPGPRDLALCASKPTVGNDVLGLFQVSGAKIGLEKKVLQARAALDAVHEATWGFAYYSDKLKRNIRPYTTNATLLMEIKQRVAQAIDQWYI